MVKPDNHSIVVKVPNDLIKEIQACQINSIKVALANITNTGIDNEQLKSCFDYGNDGARNEPYHFQKFGSYLRDLKIPFRIDKKTFNDVNELFPLLHKNIPIPVFFEMPILRKIIEAKNHFKYNIGDGVYTTDKKHILLLVGYKEKGDKLLFLEPSYKLPYLNKTQTTTSDLIEIDFKDANQNFKHIKSYIDFKLDVYLQKKFIKSLSQTELERWQK